MSTNAPPMNLYKWLFWLLVVPCFATYIVHHLICAYFFKTQNLKRRYNAQWALVTGASSGGCGGRGSAAGARARVHGAGHAHRPDPCCWAAAPAGIGKSIAQKLAKQGLNVVLVALGDQLLDKTFDELRQEYPQLQFRKVRCTAKARCRAAWHAQAVHRGRGAQGAAHRAVLGAHAHALPAARAPQVPANLGGNDYLAPIVAATSDIHVQVWARCAPLARTGLARTRSEALPELSHCALLQVIFCNAGYLLTGFFFARWEAPPTCTLCIARTRVY